MLQPCVLSLWNPSFSCQEWSCVACIPDWNAGGSCNQPASSMFFRIPVPVEGQSESSQIEWHVGGDSDNDSVVWSLWLRTSHLELKKPPGWEEKHLQEMQAGPVAYDIALMNFQQTSFYQMNKLKWHHICWRVHCDLFRTRNSKFRTWDLTHDFTF